MNADFDDITLPEKKKPLVELRQKLELLPREPGVYIFRDAGGKIIYIGKAKVLRNRVRSYFSGRNDGRMQYPLLVARIADLETIVTDTEVEALILEATLIRRHRPRFNMDVRDSASYPYLRVTNEPFPRVFLTRQPKKDSSKYYGPLTDVKQMKATVSTLRKAAHIRTCNLKITQESIAEKKHKICLEYHIGNCLGPCEGRVSMSDYESGVRMMVDAAQGHGTELIQMMESRMKTFAAQLKFEEAAKMRDRIESTRALAVRQKVLSRDQKDRDIFGFTQVDQNGCVAVLRMREGHIIGRYHVYLTRLEGRNAADIWSRVLADYYVNDTQAVPDEVLIPDELHVEDFDLFEEFLTAQRERKVRVFTPQRGAKAHLLKMAYHNAELLLTEYLAAKEREKRIPHSLEKLKEHLGLENLPHVIECFDNSNLFGQQPVASMVQFRDGKPYKKEYRHFKIKTVVGIDDFGSMQEIVGRRYSRLLREEQPLPDLVLIDGGIGQVNAARRVLDGLGLKELMCVGLAKRFEEIVFPFSQETITLPKTSSALKLLMQLRDEAHRFAITFHRKLRNAAQISSTLESIEGIGETKAKALLKHFGSVKKLREATPKMIAHVPGFSKKSSETLHRRLREADE